MIVLVAEIAAGAWAYHNSAKLDSYVRSAVKEAVQDEYSVVATRTTTMDSIQKYVSILRQFCSSILYIGVISFQYVNPYHAEKYIELKNIYFESNTFGFSFKAFLSLFLQSSLRGIDCNFK